MSRNTKIRSHRYIPSGKKTGPKGKPNFKRFAYTEENINGFTRNQKAVYCLNGLLLLLPWSILYSLGVLM